MSKELKNYVRSMRMLLEKNNPDQKRTDYWRFCEKQAKSIKCRPYESDIHLKKIVESCMKLWQPKIKECYHNSLQIALRSHGQINVIAGWTTAVCVPIEHAWNHYKPANIYFDVTKQIVLNDNVTEGDYLKILDLDATQTTEIMMHKNFTIMGLTAAWYFRRDKWMTNKSQKKV